MKKWILALVVASVPLGFIAGLARGQSGGDALEMRAQRINSLANRVSVQQSMRVVASQTGLAPDRLQSLRTQFPQSGPAGLTIASTLATNTRKSPEQFLNSRSNGRSWGEIARNNNVPVSTINVQLDRLERGLNSLTATGRPQTQPPKFITPITPGGR